MQALQKNHSKSLPKSQRGKRLKEILRRAYELREHSPAPAPAAAPRSFSSSMTERSEPAPVSVDPPSTATSDISLSQPVTIRASTSPLPTSASGATISRPNPVLAGSKPTKRASVFQRKASTPFGSITFPRRSGSIQTSSKSSTLKQKESFSTPTSSLSSFYFHPLVATENGEAASLQREFDAQLLDERQSEGKLLKQ